MTRDYPEPEPLSYHERLNLAANWYRSAGTPGDEITTMLLANLASFVELVNAAARLGWNSAFEAMTYEYEYTPVDEDAVRSDGYEAAVQDVDQTLRAGAQDADSQLEQIRRLRTWVAEHLPQDGPPRHLEAIEQKGQHG